jgi:hypothetical protein
MIDVLTIVERNDLILSKPNAGPDTRPDGELNNRFGAVSGRRYGYLRLRLDRRIPASPGQFAMIKPRGIFEPLLRRAMAYYRSVTVNGAPCVDFIYQILGRGTQALANLRVGDEVDFLGSLGNAYDIEAAQGREALLVAGGVGSAALFMLAEELVKLDARVKLFIGGASRGDLCGLDDFIELLSEENRSFTLAAQIRCCIESRRSPDASARRLSFRSKRRWAVATASAWVAPSRLKTIVLKVSFTNGPASMDLSFGEKNYIGRKIGAISKSRNRNGKCFSI